MFFKRNLRKQGRTLQSSTLTSRYPLPS